MAADPHEILDFWFGGERVSPEELELRSELWFGRHDAFDREIRQRFGDLPGRAAGSEFEAWREEAGSALALVLILDQFPRNLYRGSPSAFAFDALAQEVALAAIAMGFDETLHPLRASFLYLPLEHAEEIGQQERCVELFERLVGRAPAGSKARFDQFAEYARRHRDVVRRFGRFPHRNLVLGRQPTATERAYLESGGDTFG